MKDIDSPSERALDPDRAPEDPPEAARRKHDPSLRPLHSALLVRAQRAARARQSRALAESEIAEREAREAQRLTEELIERLRSG